MIDIFNIKKQATQLRKQKSYTEAVSLYKELWENHQEACDEWDGWGYAFCLRKIGQVDQACQIANEVNERWPGFEMNHSLLAWCIYDLEINRAPEEIKKNESDYFGAVNKILNLVKQDQYSPYTRTIFKVIEYLEKSSVNYPAEYILTWLEKLNPNQLSLDTWEGKDGKGRTIEHASYKEKWYTEKCKALFESNRFQECIEFCEQTLGLFGRLHYSNDKWIKRRIALSYEALNTPEKAAEWLEQILDSKSEWYIQFEMARFQLKLGNHEQALKYASEAALNRQGLEFKWKLFQMMAIMLKQMGEIELAKQHGLLATKIRIENEWKIPQELHNLLNDMGVNPEASSSAQQIEKQLIAYWRSIKLADLPKNYGYIKNIVSSGKSGFIMGDDRREYYFRIDSFEGDKNIIAPGLRVDFYVIKSEIPNKLDSAIHIRVHPK
jgi:tetratricopeptide (TPR) repeat protein